LERFHLLQNRLEALEFNFMVRADIYVVF
jgi:hypothetical protein